MSNGKIIKPTNPILPNSPLERNICELIHSVVPTLEIQVENSEWQTADKELKQELSNKDSLLKQGLDSVEQKISSIEIRLGSNEGSVSDELKVIREEIVSLKKRKPLEVIIKVNNKKAIDLGFEHSQLPNLMQILSTKLNVYLVGPAGSGKTTAAIHCAKSLDIPFYYTGAIASEFKLTGFINAQGQIVATEFRKAYENGGLFLFDEIDASYPQAILAFNAALANDYMDFPDKQIKKHENFYCIAAANTFGQGADRQYVGRNQLDAASLDRFVFIDWKFDENLERELAANDEWVDFVQEVRRTITELDVRHIVSPRASINGSKLLVAGIERCEVEKSVIWKGLDKSTIKMICENLEPSILNLVEYDCAY